MIERCPIIPIKEHCIYYNGVVAVLLEAISDNISPKFTVDSAMFYAKLKIIVEKTPNEICINMFCKLWDDCSAF